MGITEKRAGGTFGGTSRGGGRRSWSQMADVTQAPSWNLPVMKAASKRYPNSKKMENLEGGVAKR